MLAKKNIRGETQEKGPDMFAVFHSFDSCFKFTTAHKAVKYTQR